MELRRRFGVRTSLVLATALQLLTAAFGVLALMPATPAEAAQTIPYKINFQGRLTDNSGNVLSDGSYNIKFRFFDAATVGTNKWEGDRVYGVSDNRVTIQNGLFNIQFGDTAKGDPALTPALFNTVANGALYLEVELPTPATATCATNGCAVFTEGAMTPRQPLAATPYAFNADTVDGLDGASLVQLSPSLQQTGTINVSGTITSGGTLQGNTVDATTSGALTLGSSNATSVALAKNTTLAGGLTLTLQGNNALALGSTTSAGGIIFNDGTVNNRAVTLSTPALAASYNLNLPSSAPGTDVCLKSGTITAANLTWANCGATLQDAYDTSSTPAQITTSSGTKDVVIKSGVGFNSATAFRVIPDGTATPTLNVDTQNNRVGIGTASPSEALEVAGGIRLGSSSGTNAGTIRWDGSDFAGFDGSTWQSLTNGGLVQTTPISSASKTSADTSLASTTALTPETDLALSIGANEVWVIRYVVHASVNSAADIKFQVTAPAGATCKVGLQGVEDAISVGNTACAANLTQAVATAGPLDDVFEIMATVTNSTTPGSVNLLWGPNASSGTATIFRQGSTMQAVRSSGTNTPFQAIIQGGNSFGAAAQIGTTDAQDVVFLTGGTEAARLSTTGDLTVAGRVSIETGEVYAINGVQITSAALSNDNALTKQGNTFNGVSQLVQTTAGGALPALSGAALTSLNPTNLAAGTGAVTLQSAAATGLTLTAGNGTIIIGSNTIQHTTTSFNIDVAVAGTSTLNITNSNVSNVANLDVEGGLNIGTGQTYKIGSTQISSAALSNDSSITKQANTFNGASQLVQLNGSSQLPAVSGALLTNLNPTNLVQGTGAITLQPAAASSLNLTTTGVSGIVLTPGTGGTTTNLAAGVQAKFTASAPPTADLVVIGNAAGQEPTGNAINALQLNWYAKPAVGNMSAGYRVDVRNNNTAVGGQVQGVRIVATGAGTTINSDTTGVYIDALANASSGTATENAIEIGSGWDAGIYIQSGGNIISSAVTNSALTLNQSANPVAGAASLYVRNTNGAPSGNLIDIGNNTASVFNISATGTAAFQPTTDSQTALTVSRSAAAGGTRLFTVDTEGTTDPVEVQVGSSSSIDGVQVNFGLDSSNVFADAGTCTTTSNQGAMYYNATASSNAIRACINGIWEDLISTGGLGILAFGVVPDSSNAASPGDVAGISGNVNSPCKVTWQATQAVQVNPCIAYSGGRKVIVPATIISTSGILASRYVEVCLNSTGVPALVGAGGASETVSGQVPEPTFSANNPLLCLATLRMSVTNGNITAGSIYDVRTFTNTEKEFVTINAVSHPGMAVRTSASGNIVTTTTAAADVYLRGIVVATSGTASTTAVNGIIAVGGLQFVKATATVVTVPQMAIPTTTAGYITSTATVPTTAFNVLGTTVRSNDTAGTCTAATNCQFSVLVDLNRNR